MLPNGQLFWPHCVCRPQPHPIRREMSPGHTVWQIPPSALCVQRRIARPPPSLGCSSREPPPTCSRRDQHPSSHPTATRHLLNPRRQQCPRRRRPSEKRHITRRQDCPSSHLDSVQPASTNRARPGVPSRTTPDHNLDFYTSDLLPRARRFERANPFRFWILGLPTADRLTRGVSTISRPRATCFCFRS